ncbi:hypothetical protein EX30DRAFT_343216 [Ascodesmis nigricans]|uniref:VWFA domain-containing protein n=1 Tax=Ascodesmis nigricans TaxID=341454 RepID=A0A4S2MN27_9PEZI|nr:hypothetical protein EX30DRAFT_343216 [Ascodesmis nigricans]
MYPRTALLGTVLLLPSSVLSFGTITGSGQNAEHERITRAAFACAQGAKSNGECFEPVSLDNLAGRQGTFGAVGSPDGSGSVVSGDAHCDNADFLDVPGYAQSRAQANARLTACRTYLSDRMLEGINNAIDMLDDDEAIKENEVDDTSCTFGPFPNTPGDAKCEALEGFGRALHGVQDIYSHSNWGDTSNASLPISITNPPGLGRSGVIPWMDLRQTGGVTAEQNFATGCFLDLPNVACVGRITHGTLNKDGGEINAGSGAATLPRTTRGQIGTNFANAVSGAIADSKRLWRIFRSEIKRAYGDKIGNKLICAMTRDDPVKDCQGRLIAIAVDSSGSNQDTDPSNLRITAASQLNSQLISQADAGASGVPDQVTVIDFDDSARVIYPLGDPDSASFAGIDSYGGTCIGCGLRAALNELSKDPDVELEDRAGVVILTDGVDGSPSVLTSQLSRASSLGVRVNFGFLTAPPIPVPVPKHKRRDLEKRQLQSGLLTNILSTGGVFAVINSAEAQANFITLVNSLGLTNLDGAGSAAVNLLPDIEVYTTISDALSPRYFNYNPRAGERFTITVTPREGSPELTAILTDIRTGTVIAQNATGSSPGPITITLQASASLELELEVIAAAGTSDSVISVGLDTDAPTIPPVTSSAVPPSSTTESSVSGFPSISSNFTVIPTGTGTGIVSPTVTGGTGTGTGTGGPIVSSPPPFPTTTTVRTTIVTTTTVTTGTQTVTITKGDGATTCITRPHPSTITITSTIKCKGSCGHHTAHVPAHPWPSNGLPPPVKCTTGNCHKPPKPCKNGHCGGEETDADSDSDSDSEDECEGDECPPKGCNGGKCPHPTKGCNGHNCPHPPKETKTHPPQCNGHDCPHPPKETKTHPPQCDRHNCPHPPKETKPHPSYPSHPSHPSKPSQPSQTPTEECKQTGGCTPGGPGKECNGGKCQHEVPEQFTGSAAGVRASVMMAVLIGVVVAVVGGM